MMFFGYSGACSRHGLLKLANNYTYQLDISKKILCVPNGYCIQNFHPREVDVSTSHLGLAILLELHLLGLGFWVFVVFSS
jgi:hypothetical protein